MQSIIYARKEDKEEATALNMVILAQGPHSAVYRLVGWLIGQCENRLGNDITLYDDSALEKAEFHPANLKRTANYSRMLSHISSEKSVFEYFSGYRIDRSDPTQVRDLQDYLFRMPAEEDSIKTAFEIMGIDWSDSAQVRNLQDQLSRAPTEEAFVQGVFDSARETAFHKLEALNEQQVEQLIRNSRDRLFGGDHAIHPTPMRTDAEIRVKSDPLCNTHTQTRVTICLRPQSFGESLSSYVDWYQDLIRSCDRDYGDCVCSAFISCEPVESPIVHEAFYSCTMGEDDYTLYLPGNEWFTYMSHALYQRLSADEKEQLDAAAVVKAGVNGVSLMACDRLADFDFSVRRRMSSLLIPLLRPGYALLDPEELKEPTKRVPLYPPAQVFLYHTLAGFQIVYPFGLQPDEIQDGAIELEKQGMYYLGKERLINIIEFTH